jgi:hypothetical protein
LVEEWIACDSPPLSSEARFSDIERRDGYVFPRLAVAPSDAFTTDFSFVNLIEHKAEEIVGFYGDREHKGRCQSLARKRRLNRVFKAMGLCYADQLGPLTNLSANDAAPCGHGRGALGRRGRARKVTVGRGTNTAAMVSHKRKLSGRGHVLAEPTDMQIGREIAGKLGNSKKVMIGQTHRFGQVWTEMVVLYFFLYNFDVVVFGCPFVS